MDNKGLAPHTGKIFEDISKLECIKPFVLVGGTALALQLGHRTSIDSTHAKVRTWTLCGGKVGNLINWILAGPPLKKS